MNVTNNLKLPQYTEEDIFDLQDINKAYDSIDKAYKEVIDFKNEIPKTNATAEVIDARGGKETLGERLNEFDEQLERIINYSIILNIYDFAQYVVNDDWSEAFQKAFDKLAENYNDTDINKNTSLISMLEVPSGKKYKITKTVYIKSPVLVKGIGANGTTCISGSWSGNNYFDLFEIRDTTHSARICFENIRFSSIPPTKSAIYAPHTFTENNELKTGFMVDGYIKSCWFESFATNNSCAIRGTIANYLIEGNVFEHMNPCIDISVHDGQNRIVNNMMYNCYAGINIIGFNDNNAWQTKDIIIANNNFNYSPNDSVGGSFVKIDKYSNFIINGNSITNNNSNQLLDIAIVLSNVKAGVISNNVLSGIVLYGIKCNNAYNCNITSNIIEKNTTSNSVIAISLDNSKLNNISNNMIYNLSNIENSQGILLSNESNSNIITNNICRDVYYGIRITDGIENKINSNLVKASYLDYNILTPNFVDDSCHGITVISEDYEVNEETRKVIKCVNKSFKTINLGTGKYSGKNFEVITTTGTVQLYDGANNISLGSLSKNQSCKVIWNGNTWETFNVASNNLILNL